MCYHFLDPEVRYHAREVHFIEKKTIKVQGPFSKPHL